MKIPSMSGLSLTFVPNELFLETVRVSFFIILIDLWLIVSLSGAACHHPVNFTCSVLNDTWDVESNGTWFAVNLYGGPPDMKSHLEGRAGNVGPVVRPFSWFFGQRCVYHISGH